MPDVTRIAFFGGIYSNYLALQRALELAKKRGVDAIWALGDFGAFGPYPDRTVEILRSTGLSAIQGNYEESLSTAATDCHCGYVDPRDNHYAQISYDYTAENTSPEHKLWMATLPKTVSLEIGGKKILLCHGSPRKINEFLWSSTTPKPFVERLLSENESELIVCTHTGIGWSRLDENHRGIVNCGALGRPANDGKTNVWFAIVEISARGVVTVEMVPVDYDHARLAREMREEKLPAEFVETILSGWWTTCLEILPAKERSSGRY